MMHFVVAAAAAVKLLFSSLLLLLPYSLISLFFSAPHMPTFLTPQYSRLFALAYCFCTKTTTSSSSSSTTQASAIEVFFDSIIIL